jgi:hypothetical protein
MCLHERHDTPSPRALQSACGGADYGDARAKCAGASYGIIYPVK